MQAHIVKVTKEHNISDYTDFLDVSVEFLEDDKVIATKRLGYSIDTKIEDIKKDIKKIKVGMEQDKAIELREIEKNIENKNIKKIIDNLQDTIIK